MDKKTPKQKWAIAHPNYYKEHNKAWRAKNRLIALRKISGSEEPFCIRCGIKKLDLLNINHKKDNAAQDRGVGKHHIGHNVFMGKIARGLRKVNDLEILCSVCNWAYFVEKKFNVAWKIKFLNKIKDNKLTTLNSPHFPYKAKRLPTKD